MTNSRRKGISGELAVVKLFEAAGYHARRSQQRLGAPDAPDVIVEECRFLAVEVKNRQVHNFWDSMAKARRDASSDQLPVVFAKKNRAPWLVTMEPATFFALLERYVAANSPLDVQQVTEFEPIPEGLVRVEGCRPSPSPAR